ncbi:hypothetical protein EON65_27950 [archaeon]|nr:MAG: hypothetical protein EON65_27950 [archaeon]
MTSLVEVKILNYTIVLPLQEDSTILSIAQAALEEFKGFNLKKPPQKVLYVRDPKGRILSNHLRFPVENVGNVLEVIVEDYSSKDALGVEETETLYRSWQLWTLAQLQEHIQLLSFQEVPPTPSTAVLNLLQELSNSGSEVVQQGCLSVYRTLLRKFPHKVLVVSAAQHICRVFSTSSFPEIAVFALESFRDLSPLQLRLFDMQGHMRYVCVLCVWHGVYTYVRVCI